MSLHFILDGYNVINREVSLTGGKLEEQRENLIRLIETEQPQGSEKNRVTIVFDGQPDVVGGVGGGEAVRVIFTSGESADDKIKQIVDEDEQRKSIIVVTDDKGIQYHVRAAGAKVMGVGTFLDKTKSHQGRPCGNDEKKITKSFEHKINTEFEDKWLRKKGQEP